MSHAPECLLRQLSLLGTTSFDYAVPRLGVVLVVVLRLVAMMELLVVVVVVVVWRDVLENCRDVTSASGIRCEPRPGPLL